MWLLAGCSAVAPLSLPGCWVTLATLPCLGHFRQAGMQENVLFTRSRKGVVLLMSLALGTSPCRAPSALADPPLPAGSKALISSSSLKGDGPNLCFRCLRTWGKEGEAN